MKSWIVLGCAANIALGAYHSSDSWSKGHPLQVRSIETALKPRISNQLQHRHNPNYLFPRSHKLQIRSGRDRSSRSPGRSNLSDPAIRSGIINAAGRPGRSRSPSPPATVHAHIEGPGVMTTAGRKGVQTAVVPEEQHDSLHDKGDSWVKASAAALPYQNSPGSTNPRRQFLKAETASNNGIATVRPPPGGRGNIRVEEHGKEPQDFPVTGPDVGHRTAKSDVRRGAKIIATSEHGGEVVATGTTF